MKPFPATPGLTGVFAPLLLEGQIADCVIEGDLPAGVDIGGLTSYLYALLQGMAVQAGSGASRADLERMVDTSLAIWPGR